MIKKPLIIVFSFLLVMIAVGQLNAQQWQVYDASVLPDAHDPAFISSNTKTGVPTWTIQDDPDISGNKYLEMLSPNVETETAGMWKTSDFSPVPTKITVVARIKAAGDVSTYEEVLDLDMRVDPLREKLIIGSDNKLDFDKADVQVTPTGFDVAEWHTYRLVFDVTTGKVDLYLDEGATPILTGTTTSSESEKYFRFGDGSNGKSYGALIDWIALDTTGAYAPGEGDPIPVKDRDIVFVSRPDKHDDINNVHPDSSHIDELIAAGYEVTTFYNTALETASQATMDTLHDADLVILGRSCASGIFGGTHRFAWNSVTAPILALSPYFVRSNRMNWFNTTSCVHHDSAGFVMNAVIEVIADPVFTGLTLTDGKLPWAVGPYDVVSIKDAGNGELLASSVVDSTVQFVRFDPWIQFYDGSLDRAAGYRTLIGNGNDNTADPTTGDKIYNYNNFTTESKQVYLNEVARMSRLSKDVPKPPVEGNIVFVSRPDKHDDINNVHPDSSHIDELIAAGYTVTTFYNDTLGNAPEACMDMLNNADLVILGRSAASGIFGGDHKPAWNSVTAPILALSPYFVRSNRMNWFNTTSCVHHDSAGFVMKTIVEEPSDYVFGGLTLTGDTLSWAVGPYDVVSIKDVGNGELLARSVVDSTVQFVRFDPWNEFYPGANDRPAGYRTLIGNGNDNTANPATGDKIYNYNNFTTESKQVYFKEIERLISLPRVLEQPRKIVFVSRPDKHDDINNVHPDSSHIDELIAAGYVVTTFYNTALETASKATMDTLHDADLVILGRSCASGIFGGTNKYAWNSVGAPILALSPYFVRSNRMNWFNTTSCAHLDEAGAVMTASIKEPDDPVFDGLTLIGGNLPWAWGPYDVLVIKDAGNGELLASSVVDSTVQFVRFDPWVQFYRGAGDKPAGHRTMIGNGNDNTADPTTGDKIYNYNNFTTESKQVYLNEVARMSRLSKDVPKPPVEGNIVFVSRPDKHDDINNVHPDSSHIDELIAAGYTVTTFYNDTLGNAPEACMDMLNNADLVILGRSAASGIFGGDHKEAWNSVKKPILALSPYFVRNNRMNWFNTDKCVHHDSAGFVMNVTVEEPSDYVFGGLTLAGDTLSWAVGPYDLLDIKDAGNGTLLASSAVDSTVQFVRFKPWVEFYEGAIDMPAGYRTLIGNGNDNTADPTTGDKIYNYNNFTDESKQVYLKEVERMITLGPGGDPPVAIANERDGIPTAYKLNQNYPNPFNPTTNIQFHLPKSGNVTITIYNILGQIVTTLVNRRMEAGVHTIAFDARNYASGVYFYRIHSGDFTKAKKMMLLK